MALDSCPALMLTAVALYRPNVDLAASNTGRSSANLATIGLTDCYAVTTIHDSFGLFAK